ncbi:MAG: hypothetical protein ACRCWJ_02005, partial [Casimicrobium sp.]
PGITWGRSAIYRIGLGYPTQHTRQRATDPIARTPLDTSRPRWHRHCYCATRAMPPPSLGMRHATATAPATARDPRDRSGIGIAIALRAQCRRHRSARGTPPLLPRATLVRPSRRRASLRGAATPRTLLAINDKHRFFLAGKRSAAKPVPIFFVNIFHTARVWRISRANSIVACAS